MASILAGDAQVKRFEGVWRAEHQGKAFVILRVRGSAGTISTGAIGIDDEGEVSRVVHAASGELKLREVKVVQQKLTFKTAGAGPEETEYEMRLQGDGAAELRIVDAPPPAKPFLLRRS